MKSHDNKIFYWMGLNNVKILKFYAVLFFYLLKKLEVMSIELNVNKLQDLSLKTKVDDEQEEILRENTRRFCLFPIKYHEVKEKNKIVFSLLFLLKCFSFCRFGNSIRRQKHLFGQLKK